MEQYGNLPEASAAYVLAAMPVYDASVAGSKRNNSGDIVTRNTVQSLIGDQDHINHHGSGELTGRNELQWSNRSQSYSHFDPTALHGSGTVALSTEHTGDILFDPYAWTGSFDFDQETQNIEQPCANCCTEEHVIPCALDGTCNAGGKCSSPECTDVCLENDCNEPECKDGSCLENVYPPLGPACFADHSNDNTIVQETSIDCNGPWCSELPVFHPHPAIGAALQSHLTHNAGPIEYPDSAVGSPQINNIPASAQVSLSTFASNLRPSGNSRPTASFFNQHHGGLMQHHLTDSYHTFGAHNSNVHQHPTFDFSLNSEVLEHDHTTHAWELSYGSTQTETPDLTDYSLSSGGNTPFVGAPWPEHSNINRQIAIDQAEYLARKHKRRCADLKRDSTSISSSHGSPRLGELAAFAAGDNPSHLRMEQRPTCLWIPYADGLEESKPCMQAFDSAAELHEHIKREHTGRLQKNYSCRWADCARFDKANDFKQRGKLERHMVTHSGYLEFACHLCDKQYGTREQLKNHMTTHTGERRYQCSYCTQRSATATQHKNHERTHTKEKPFKCPHPGCDYASGDSSNLSKHIKTHEPHVYRCPHPACNIEPTNRWDNMKRHFKSSGHCPELLEAGSEAQKRYREAAEAAAVAAAMAYKSIEAKSMVI